jgi:hypothetical protein
MSLVTEWGYELTAVDTLADLITTDEFNTLTANKYSGDVRIAPEIKAVSAAVRNFCGWHVAPSLACKVSEALLYGNGILKRVGSDLLVQLPTRFLTSITSITVGGVSYPTDYRAQSNGLLHVFDVAFDGLDRKSVVEIVYIAGLSRTDAIKELVANQVTHALASSYGVTSESAGGMSITYNAGWVNGSKATALSDDAKDILTPYMVRGVF